jgi:hypothetical protein
MVIRSAKSSKFSPTFKTHEERLKHCAETTQSSQRIIETSKKLTADSREIIENIHRHHPKLR